MDGSLSVITSGQRLAPWSREFKVASSSLPKRARRK
jgi:hypothetical protein